MGKIDSNIVEWFKKNGDDYNEVLKSYINRIERLRVENRFAEDQIHELQAEREISNVNER